MKEKILIVDDAEFNRELLREILGEDYDIMEAENGEAALEIIKQEKEVAAILLDLVMPVMDGFEFMLALRDLKLMGKIPVLVISGEKSVQSEKKCFDYGVSDFIGRPFNAMLVRKRVQNVVNHYAYDTGREAAESKPGYDRYAW